MSNSASTISLPQLSSAGDAAFRCPGEPVPISRAVHLARLAAGHAACRDCPHRAVRSSLPPRMADQARRRAEKTVVPLISARGVRGEYQNRLTRGGMSELAQHVVQTHLSLAARYANTTSRQRQTRVVVGRDARDSSPDLALGVLGGVVGMSCEVADVGLVTRPELEFSLARLGADLGLFVTGGEEHAGLNGLEIVDAAGVPWTAPGRLDALRDDLPRPITRPARTAGCLQAVDQRRDYEAALSYQFHALRPLRLAVRAPDDGLTALRLRRLLEPTGCELHLAPDHVGRGGDGESHHWERWLSSRRCDVAFWLGADGRECRVFSETCQQLPAEAVLQWLRQTHITTIPEEIGTRLTGLREGEAPAEPRSLTDRPRGRTPGSADPPSKPTPGVQIGPRDRHQPSPSQFRTIEDLLRTQQRRRTPVVTDGDDRYWLLGELPACDSLLTLARVLQALSFDNRLLSKSSAARDSHARENRNITAAGS